MSLHVFRGEQAERSKRTNGPISWASSLCACIGLLSLTCIWNAVFVADPVIAGDQRTSTLTYEDPDHDGLPTSLEFVLGTDPLSFDTDGDGFDDGLEVTVSSDALNHDDIIDGDSAVQVHFFPLIDNHLGILVTAYGHEGIRAFERFRILSGRGGNYTNHTRTFHDGGQRLESENRLIESLAVSIPLADVGQRLNVIAEFLEYGELRSVTRAFGHFNGDIFIQNFTEDADGFLWGKYNVLGRRPYLLVPGIGSNWGIMPVEGGDGSGGGRGGTEYLADHVFTEKVMRYRSRGVIIDTVIENRCAEEPDEQCPLALNTVGEIRIGPSR